MLEVEIQKLTAAIAALTEELKSAKVGNQLATETAAEKSYREDNAAREEMQRMRDEAAAKSAETKSPKKAPPKKAAEPVAIDHEAARDPVSEPDKASPPKSDITADTIKTVAMELVRAESSARFTILEILDEHGAKTITQLDPKEYASVHHELLGLAKNIFNKSEAV